MMFHNPQVVAFGNRLECRTAGYGDLSHEDRAKVRALHKDALKRLNCTRVSQKVLYDIYTDAHELRSLGQ